MRENKGPVWPNSGRSLSEIADRVEAATAEAGGIKVGADDWRGNLENRLFFFQGERVKAQGINPRRLRRIVRAYTDLSKEIEGAKGDLDMMAAYAVDNEIQMRVSVLAENARTGVDLSGRLSKSLPERKGPCPKCAVCSPATDTKFGGLQWAYRGLYKGKTTGEGNCAFQAFARAVWLEIIDKAPPTFPTMLKYMRAEHWIDGERCRPEKVRGNRN